MSDLYLKPTSEGGDVAMFNGRPETTNSLEVAVYLSLFTPAWWGNLVSEQSEKYTTTLPDLFDRRLTISTLRSLEVAAENALAWMIGNGIAERVDTEATLMSRNQVYLRVTIYEPRSAGVDFAYAVNWAEQEAQLL